MNTPTKFMNSKKRVIFQSDRGAYFVRNGDTKRYGIKAAFKKSPSGTPKKLTDAMMIPKPLRPDRKLPKVYVTNFMKRMTTTNANIKKLRELNTN
jgi:hypothetical protein